MDTKRIAILLATYNGEQYIWEQLDSLMEQSFDNYTIYAHDDGSTDNTVNILKYQKAGLSKPAWCQGQLYEPTKTC